MTKSTITRERAQQIFLGNGPEPSASEERELARMALAAMDSSESVELPLDYLQGHKDGLEWAAQLAEANHPETGDWLYDDPIELAKAIRKGPDMPPVQPAPVVSAELLHTAASAIEDLLTTKDRTGACVWFDLPFRLRSAANAHSAPVVPDDVLAALQKVARIRLDLNDFDGDRRGIADCLGDAEEALIEVVNRRAAMLAAAPHDTHALNSVQSVDSVADRWIPVSERMPEIGDIVLTAMGGVVNVGEMECSAANCRFFTSVISGRELPATHWMPMPTAPQEVK